jgi:hypothetical protein
MNGMTSSRSLTLSLIALGASVIFVVWVVAYRLAHPPPLHPARVSAQSASPDAASSSQPPPQPETSEGKATLRIAGLLSDLRRKTLERRVAGRPSSASEAADTERMEGEVLELSTRLLDDLRRNPGSWSEVIHLATWTDDLKVALRLATLLGAAGDSSSEALWTNQMVAGSVAKERHVAATALAGGTSIESLNALISAADRETDAGARLAAITSLAQRRIGAPSPALALSIEDALRRRAENDPDPQLRQVARTLVAPTPRPGTVNPHKNGLPPIEVPK